jgi:hypothetical protein
VSIDYQGMLVMGSPAGRHFLGAVVGQRYCRFDSVRCLL